MTHRPLARLAAAFAAFGFLALPAAAQDRIADPARVPDSPLAPALERLDAGLRSAAMSGDDPASRWIAGQRETLDVAARVREFGLAAARDPAQRLYVASLARACLAPAARSLPECGARDTVAYWASRDADNAAPWLLLAARAQSRRLTANALEDLERAARAPRFDDYAASAAPLVARRFAALPGGGDPVLVALATQRFLAGLSGGFGPVLEDLCGPGRGLQQESATTACLRVAALLVGMAPEDADRALGAGLAAARAPTPSGRAAAAREAAAIARERQRCADAFARLEEAATAGSDARSRGAASRWLEARGRETEREACAALATALDVPR